MDLSPKQLEILIQAEKLFANNGFDATSVRDIANKANCNVSMINYYFGSKDELLLAIVDYRLVSFRMSKENIEGIADPFKRIDALIDHYLNCFNENSHIYQILTSQHSIKEKISKSQVFYEAKVNNINVIKSIIDYGVAQKMFKIYDPILIHTTIMGIFANYKFDKAIYKEYHQLKTTQQYQRFLKKELTQHLKTIIKAVLKHED